MMTLFLGKIFSFSWVFLLILFCFRCFVCSTGCLHAADQCPGHLPWRPGLQDTFAQRVFKMWPKEDPSCELAISREHIVYMRVINIILHRYCQSSHDNLPLSYYNYWKQDFLFITTQNSFSCTLNFQIIGMWMFYVIVVRQHSGIQTKLLRC